MLFAPVEDLGLCGEFSEVDCVFNGVFAVTGYICCVTAFWGFQLSCYALVCVCQCILYFVLAFLI